MFKLFSFLFASVIIWNTFPSCSCKKNKIIHLDFLDNLGITYNIMDTEHKKPLNDMAAYFVINQSKLKCIDFKNLEEFISTDTFIQKQIRKNYAEMSLYFYRKSKATDLLIENKSRKFLTLSNNALVAEYLWSNGKPYDTLYYENGKIKGSEKIKLK
jgi:hypothetical protein